MARKSDAHKMIVFVVLGSYNYEGFDNPIGVYSSRNLAEIAAVKLKENKEKGYDGVEILEYVVQKE